MVWLSRDPQCARRGHNIIRVEREEPKRCLRYNLERRGEENREVQVLWKSAGHPDHVQVVTKNTRNKATNQRLARTWPISYVQATSQRPHNATPDSRIDVSYAE